MQQNSGEEKPVVEVPTSEEFTRALGQVTWLMTVSKEHRDIPVTLIEAHVVAPLMFKQVRVILQGKQPVAAVIWAYTSAAVREKLSRGEYVMTLQDWRSGPEVKVVDCISPFVDKQTIINDFMAEVARAKRGAR